MFSFFCLRVFTYPFAFFSHQTLGKCGKILGILAYYLIPSYRKRALSNLAMTSLPLSEEELKRIVKSSFQSLATVCLEMPKLAREKNMRNLVSFENEEVVSSLTRQGKGLIFFLGHQSNWEVVMPAITQFIPGIAIGKPLRNPYLYRWLVSIRQKYGAKLIFPKHAFKEGYKALKKGLSLGIVGDQAFLNGASFPFFGLPACTSPLPALLAVKTDCPLVVVTTSRKKEKYLIRYSNPFFSQKETPLSQEIPRLMNQLLGYLEKSIKENPEEYLWIHNRWKQDPQGLVHKRFYKDMIAILLPDNRSEFVKLEPYLSLFRSFYPKSFLTFYTPFASSFLPDAEIIMYKNKEELFIKDYRFKLVFNFTSDKELSKHFLKLSSHEVISMEDLKKRNIPFQDALMQMVSYAH